MGSELPENFEAASMRPEAAEATEYHPEEEARVTPFETNAPSAAPAGEEVADDSQTESDGEGEGFDEIRDRESQDGIEGQAEAPKGPRGPRKVQPIKPEVLGRAPSTGLVDSPASTPNNQRPAQRSRAANDITLEDLSAWFHVPSEQAAKKLGIGLTVLKRQCRKYGIRRWPFRKLKSLDRLMENIQTSVAPPEQNVRYQKSVEELQNQKQRMEMGLELELDEETKKLQQAYSKANHKLRQQVKARMSKQLADGTSTKGSEDGLKDGHISPDGLAACATSGSRRGNADGALSSHKAAAQAHIAKMEEAAAAAVASLDPEQAKQAQHLIEQCMAQMPHAHPGAGEDLQAWSTDQVEQFSIALAAMLAYAQQGQSGGDTAGVRYDDDGTVSADGSRRHADDASEGGEADAENGDSRGRRRPQRSTRRPRWHDNSDDGFAASADALASLAELAEREGHNPDRKIGSRGGLPKAPSLRRQGSRSGHFDQHDFDAHSSDEHLTEVEVLARLQMYAQEMGYLLQSTTVLPLPSGRRRGLSEYYAPNGKRGRQ